MTAVLFSAKTSANFAIGSVAGHVGLMLALSLNVSTANASKQKIPIKTATIGNNISLELGRSQKCDIKRALLVRIVVKIITVYNYHPRCKKATYLCNQFTG